jgi:FdrA protein
MIDPSTRVELLRAALADDRTGVVVLDVVLGHGAAADPAGPLVAAVREAGAAAPCVVAFVVGTDADPQNRRAQEQRLRDAGALVVPSSTAAARLARDIRVGEGAHESAA